MPDAFAEKVKDSKIKLQQGIRSRMFDIIAALVVITLIALSLGIIERRVITLDEIGNIVVECIPFFMAAMLLNDNFYKKGIYVGKTASSFLDASKSYSDIVANLTGEQIDNIDIFCKGFNAKAMARIQETYLKRASISFDRFDNGYTNSATGEFIEPIKVWSKSKIVKTYGKERSRWILRAKNVKIKGLHSNTLLGTNDAEDVTDVGRTEVQLLKKKAWSSVMTYFVATLIMSLIAVKDIEEWGWFGIALVVFKCVFILCRSYMAYYDGYNDVTIHLVHHTNRKIDILKQFLYWFSTDRCKSVIKGNNIENLE